MMPTETLIAPPSRHLFTTADIERMLAAGVLHEDARVELIAGEIVAMAAMGPKHLRCVNRLTRLLVRAVGDTASVSVQNAIILSDRTMPQPDLTLLRGQDEQETVPTAADVLVVIEVADSSLAYDREVKLPLYAAAGIPEAWIVDLGAQRIERHTQPGPGGYNAMLRFGRGETVPSTIIASLAIPVDGALGIAQ